MRSIGPKKKRDLWQIANDKATMLTVVLFNKTFCCCFFFVFTLLLFFFLLSQCVFFSLFFGVKKCFSHLFRLCHLYCRSFGKPNFECVVLLYPVYDALCECVNRSHPSIVLSFSIAQNDTKLFGYSNNAIQLSAIEKRVENFFFI